MRHPFPGITRRVALLALLVVLLGGPGVFAQAADSESSSPDAAPLPGDVYLDASRGTPPEPEEPPVLSASRRKDAESALKSLVTSKAAVRSKAEADLVKLGRGTIPLLVEGAATTHAGRQESITRCLLALADARDRRLVEALLADERVALRRFAATAAGEIGTVRLVQALPARLADEDEPVRFEAALSLARNGRDDGLALLAAQFGEETRERVLAVLPGLAGKSSYEALVARLAVDERRMRLEPEAAIAERRAAVAMLAAIGDRRATRALAKALDDPTGLVQLDAIDALRRLLEEAGPFAATSVFAQIKEVERLKGLLGGTRD